jgi:hypothetical protein
METRNTAGRERADATVMPSGSHDLENAMHARQFENLLDGGSWAQEADGALSAGGGFVEGNQCTETAAIEKRGEGKIDFDMALA